ncbi:MAG: Transcriptional regulator, IclR family [Pseudolabrys sp.]|jgi:DNA-binding IclR family transcriptional regulator|nr:Transcriptional regulator, IclR family [Pseudolabrys sp.]
MQTNIDVGHGPEFSLSVSRALRILSSFSSDNPEWGLADLSRAMSLSKGSVGRFLQALEMHGYVDRDPETKLYRPGPETARVGSLYRSAGRLRQLAIPIMRELVQRVGFTSYISELRDDQMLILAALEGPGPIKYTIPVGTRLPVHSTATGQTALAQLTVEQVDDIIKRAGLSADTRFTVTSRAALLKRLAEVRAKGYSTNWEERTLGVGSVAAPVKAADGSPLCVLSVGFATSQIKREQVGSLGRDIKAAAKQLTTAAAAKGITRVE